MPSAEEFARMKDELPNSFKKSLQTAGAEPAGSAPTTSAPAGPTPAGEEGQTSEPTGSDKVEPGEEPDKSARQPPEGNIHSAAAAALAAAAVKAKVCPEVPGHAALHPPAIVA